jgi:hypothetical protein
MFTKGQTIESGSRSTFGYGRSDGIIEIEVALFGSILKGKKPLKNTAVPERY